MVRLAIRRLSFIGLTSQRSYAYVAGVCEEMTIRKIRGDHDCRPKMIDTRKKKKPHLTFAFTSLAGCQVVAVFFLHFVYSIGNAGWAGRARPPSLSIFTPPRGAAAALFTAPGLAPNLPSPPAALHSHPA